MLAGVAGKRLPGEVVEQRRLDEVRDTDACNAQARERGRARPSRSFLDTAESFPVTS
jgi:hypothetical protein